MEKTNQTEFRAKKVITRKDDKLYVKWDGYDNPLNNWIDEKRYLHLKWVIFQIHISVVKTK